MTRRFAWSFQATLGALGLVGVLHALAREWPDVFALYAVGRTPLAAALPWALGALLGLSLGALLLGARSRLAGAVFVLTAAILHGVAPSTYHNNYYLLVWCVGLTAALGDPAYRLGALLRGEIAPDDGRPQDVYSVGPLVRTLQALLAVVYLFSVVVKLSHPWWQGTGRVVRYLVTERAPAHDPGLLQALLRPLLALPGAPVLAELAVVLTEILLPPGLAWGPTRRAALVVGVAMHTVMHAWLFPQLFTFLMLGLYAAWTPCDDRGLTVRLHPAHRVHGWLQGALGSLDWAGRCRVEALDLPGPLRVSPSPGLEHRGPAAWVSLAARLPVALVAWAVVSLSLPATLCGVPRAAVDNAATIGVLTMALWGRGRRG